MLRFKPAPSAPPAGAAELSLCPNCGDVRPGRFCPGCGQTRNPALVSLREMVRDFLEDELSLSGRLPRTLAPLLARPGFLTTEYLRGRILRYVRPLRLYFGASVAFFLLLAVLAGDDVGVVQIGTDAGGAPDAAAPGRGELPEGVGESLSAPRPTPPPPLGAPAADGASAFEGAVREQLATWGEPGAILLARWDRILSLGWEEAARRTSEGFLAHVPQTMFVMLPAFALLLKLLYVRRGRLYVEHFVFSLHFHAFAFLTLTLILAAEQVPALHGARVPHALAGWIFVYLFLAMKRVYGQSAGKTAVKYAGLLFWYGGLLSVALMATALVALLLV